MEGPAVTKFFVSNLPEGCTPWELSSFMHRFRRCIGVSLQKKRQVGQQSVVVPDRVRAFGDLHGKAVVGRTVDLDTLVFFDRLLRIGKVSYVRLQYLGGMSLMVSFGSSEEAETFLSNKDLWGPWFSSLDLWVGQVLAVERIVWIRIQGIPVHLFGSEVFRKIGDLFGKTVYVPPDVEEESDLSGKSVGILAGNECRVKEFVSLRWKDKVFRIWVSEDDSEWLPDCIRDLDPEVLSPEKEAPEMVNSGRGGDQLEVEGGDVSGSKVMGENSNSQCPDNSDPVLNSMSVAVSSCHYFGSGDNGEAVGINKVINCKKGGARSFKTRKGKSGPASMGSPMESKPKKRVRAQVEKEDLFGLDELIQKGPFSFQNIVDLNGTGIGQTGIDGDLEASLDLNRSSNSQPGHQAAEIPSERVSDLLNEEAESGARLIEEVAATIKLGAALGVDLQDAEKMVKDSIINEGINGGFP
ncbi:hypothetical protein HanXRQr2_Chr02g0052801 [Helianthus annuus]|uniref:DUF4283 domain-containing protein n=1 Tax=Helianthus annuus TaxID=4232 RepID=A0A9K3JKQ8_HELAN|nr:hypothetical protein HanXRQr2_Chr02g0052801 [Helianthus annuus]